MVAPKVEGGGRMIHDSRRPCTRAFGDHESSQVFAQMYFTTTRLIHSRSKTRFLDSWLLESRLQAIPPGLQSQISDLQSPSPSLRAHRLPASTYLCYQLVKELTGFPPARIGSIVRDICFTPPPPTGCGWRPLEQSHLRGRGLPLRPETAVCGTVFLGTAMFGD